jgi:DUF1680 family protein
MKVGGYAYAKSNTAIYVNLYIGGTAKIALSDNTVTMIQQTEYPWGGRARITVSPERESQFSMNLRIPGWCQEARLKINGADLEQFQIHKGYACISRKWKKKDMIELDFPTPVQRIEAHPNVKEDTGLVAIQRGPIVYGLEALDNGGNLGISLPINPQFETEHRPEFLGGVTVIKGKTTEGRPFLAIPFYALANRGKSSQVVWLPQKGKKENLTGWKDELYRQLDPSTLIRRCLSACRTRRPRMITKNLGRILESDAQNELEQSI